MFIIFLVCDNIFIKFRMNSQKLNSLYKLTSKNLRTKFLKFNTPILIFRRSVKSRIHKHNLQDELMSASCLIYYKKKKLISTLNSKLY